jgi:hypothetical protein
MACISSGNGHGSPVDQGEEALMNSLRKRPTRFHERLFFPLNIEDCV